MSLIAGGATSYVPFLQFPSARKEHASDTRHRNASSASLSARLLEIEMTIRSSSSTSPVFALSLALRGDMSLVLRAPLRSEDPLGTDEDGCL